MSISLASLGARVGPYSFPAKNWSGLSVGALVVLNDLAFEKSDVNSTGEQSPFRCLVWEGRRNIQSVCLIETNKQPCILCITEIIAKVLFLIWEGYSLS